MQSHTCIVQVACERLHNIRPYREYFGKCVANQTPGAYQAYNGVLLKITQISLLILMINCNHVIMTILEHRALSYQF